MIARLTGINPSPTQLDRSLYRVALDVLAARIPCKLISRVRETIPKEHLLILPRLKSIIVDPLGDASVRGLLLNCDSHLDQLVMKEGGLGIVPHQLVLDYDYWLVEDILAASLPSSLPIPSSFEIVGHIAHLNLLPEHAPFRFLIGQVILDKHRSSLRTVVTKVAPIGQSVFRVFEMEVLAGEPEFRVEMRQSGCRFRFDYSRVYWNTRLQHEHERLILGIKEEGGTAFDVFAGVGPFAVPLARHGLAVHANDLNPDAYEALKDNARLNRVQVSGYNLDGRQFIRDTLTMDVKGRRHYIMNLPALAAEFCDVFNEFPSAVAENATTHCYLFARTGEDPVGLVSRHLSAVEMVDPQVHYVRNVAPNKDMYCVKFRLQRKHVKRLRIDKCITEGGGGQMMHDGE